MKANKLTTFSMSDLKKELATFKVSQNPIDRKVRTYIGKQKVAEYQPGTNHYQLVDFGKMGSAFLDQISSKMKISNYNLEMNGIQELRLYGDRFKIGKDEYFQQATLLSSTNGLRRFSVFAGLFRLICSNGAYTSVGESVLHSARHYKSNEEIHHKELDQIGDTEEARDFDWKGIQKMMRDLEKLRIPSDPAYLDWLIEQSLDFSDMLPQED